MFGINILEYILVVFIFSIIFGMHYDIYLEKRGFCNKFLVIMSYIIFMLIYLEHLYYIRTKNHYIDKDDDLKHIKMIISNNSALRLANNISKHPCFYI